MNSKLRKLNPGSFLFFDAETVSRNKELDINSKEFELYQWSLRDKTTNDLPESSYVQDHYKNNAALRPEFNKIVCISVGFIKNKTLYYKSIIGDQKNIVNEFYDIVTTSGLIPTGHNIIGFDLPTIRMKAFECGADWSKLPDKFCDSNKKIWNMTDSCLDTMEVFKGTHFSYTSLDSICMMAGIESPKDKLNGSEVTRAYYSGRIKEIAKYCNSDVIATAQLLCAMQGDKNYIKEYVEKVEVNRAPLIEYLLNGGIFDTDEMKELDTLLKSLNKDELEYAFEVLYSISTKKTSSITKKYINELKKKYVN